MKPANQCNVGPLTFCYYGNLQSHQAAALLTDNRHNNTALGLGCIAY